MRLWYAPRTISVAAAITLEEAGVQHDLVRVDFAAGEQTGAAYLKLNPKGRVPLLDTGTGTLLTETGAILEYIAAITPQAGLVPEDPLEAAHMRSVMYYMASTMHVNHAHSRRGHRWADKPESFADMSAKVPETMAACAEYVTQHCLRGDYILGDSYSLADAYAFVVCSWLDGDGVDLAAFPTLSAYLDRNRARPAVAAVIAKGLL